MAHASTTRISLRKGRGELRIAKIYDRLVNNKLEGTLQLFQSCFILPFVF